MNIAPNDETRDSLQISFVNRPCTIGHSVIPAPSHIPNSVGLSCVQCLGRRLLSEVPHAVAESGCGMWTNTTTATMCSMCTLARGSQTLVVWGQTGCGTGVACL